MNVIDMRHTLARAEVDVTIRDNRDQIWHVELSPVSHDRWAWKIKPLGPGEAHYMASRTRWYATREAALAATLAYIERHEHDVRGDTYDE